MTKADEMLVSLTAMTAAACWRAVCTAGEHWDWMELERYGVAFPVPPGPRRQVEHTVAALVEADLIAVSGQTRNRRVGPTRAGRERALLLAGFKLRDALRFCWRVREAEQCADKVYHEKTGRIRVDAWALDPTLGREWYRPASVPVNAWMDAMHSVFVKAVPGLLLGWVTIAFCGGGVLILYLQPLGRAMIDHPEAVTTGKTDPEARELFAAVFDADCAGYRPRTPEVETAAPFHYAELPPIPEAPAGWPLRTRVHTMAQKGGAA